MPSFLLSPKLVLIYRNKQCISHIIPVEAPFSLSAVACQNNYSTLESINCSRRKLFNNTSEGKAITNSSPEIGFWQGLLSQTALCGQLLF